MLTRTVIQDFGEHGQPQVGVEVVYTLVQLGYSSLVMFPRVSVTAVADENGRTSVDLWPNAESLARTEYEASMPDGSKHRFVLPVGESEISLISLLIAQRVPLGWTVPDVNVVIDARMDLEAALRISGDAANAAANAATLAAMLQAIQNVYDALFHAADVNYLFLDLFSADDPAPLTFPKLATVGWWEGNDGEGILHDLDGRRFFPAPATATTFVEHVNWTQASFARAPGRAWIVRVTPATAGSFRVGWDTAGKETGRTPRTHAVYFHGPSQTVRLIEESTDLTSFATFTIDETYDIAVVPRTRGCHYLMGPADTGLFERLFVTDDIATGPLYGFLSNFDASWVAEGLAEARDLAPPWDVDEVDALQYIDAASPGFFECADDGIFQMKFTAQAGVTYEARLRYVDANNYIALRVIVDSNSIALIDRVAGVETTPGAANTKTLDWVPGTAYTVKVRSDGGTHQVTIGKVLSMAPIYATHTGEATVQLTHAVDQFIYWPIHDVALPSATRFVRQRNEFWVNTQTGSDTENTGASVDVPLLTVESAIGRASGSSPIIIHLATPAGYPVRGSLLWSESKAASIVATDPDEPWLWYVSQKHTAGWNSLGGGVYSKYMPEFFTEQLQNVIVTSMTDANGFDLRLDYPTGVDVVLDNPGEGQAGWVSATMTSYIYLPGGVDPNNEVIETPIANTGIQCSGTGLLTLEDGEIRYPNIYGIAASSVGNIVATRMTSSYAMTGNFATFVGSTGTLTCTLCDGVRADNDIYSVHGGATVVLLNCTGSYSGDEIASAHDTSTMTVQGGRYHHAAQGGITSVNSATQYIYDAEVDNNAAISPSGTGAYGGVSFFDATVGGEIKRCFLHHNTGPGLWIKAGADVIVGTGADINTSGVGQSNTLPDDLAG